MQPELRSIGDSPFRAAAIRNLAGTVAGGIVIASIDYAVTRGSVPMGAVAQAGWLLRLSIHWVLASIPLGLAFLLIEYRARGGRPPRSAYTAAVAVGAASGACIVALHGSLLDPGISRTAVGFDMSLGDRFLYGLWQLGFWGSIAAVMHRTDLGYRLDADALRRAELARFHSERRMVEARLAALQGQVEPEFVVETLASIERLYMTDCETAERIIDSLIRFLRLAIPGLRGASSTVGQEIELVQAYVDVLHSLPDSHLALTADVTAKARTDTVPPGLVLSLVRRLGGPDGHGAQHIAIHAGRDGSRHFLDLSFAHAEAIREQFVGEFIALWGKRLALIRGPESSISILHDGSRAVAVRVHLGPSEGEDHVKTGPD